MGPCSIEFEVVSRTRLATAWQGGENPNKIGIIILS